MGTQSNAAPVIIKRKKIIAGGHHGGAWKVAYADFVTAMMAFFMLMWLLNATTEKQRKGLADYFEPTVAISRVSGGSDHVFGGDSMFSEDVMPKMGKGATNLRPTESDRAKGAASLDAAQIAELQKVEEALFGIGGQSAIEAAALKHVVTRVTDEGLVIELFDLPDAFLFEGRTDTPTELLRVLSRMLSNVFTMVINPVAIEGHVAARPVVFLENPVWELSTSRAERMRLMLVADGMKSERMARVTGKADRNPVVPNPLSTRNNRLEVILLIQKK
jgi:chemotaxis protein MotB